MRKKCYVCLPISGQEDTVMERINQAKAIVKNHLGYEPITPVDINNEDQEILNNPDRAVGTFMGNDVKALIDECDAIYMCKGWKSSKGCNVEYACAKQYGKEIFYECLDVDKPFFEVAKARYNQVLREYLHVVDIYGDGSLQEAVLRNSLERYQNFMKDWFGFDVIYWQPQS